MTSSSYGSQASTLSPTLTPGWTSPSFPQATDVPNEHHGHATSSTYQGKPPHPKKKRTHQHVCPIGEPFISGPFRANPNLPRDCGQHHRHGTPWSLHPEVARRKVIVKHQKNIQNTEVLSQKDMILPKRSPVKRWPILNTLQKDMFLAGEYIFPSLFAQDQSEQIKSHTPW
jgi:hypothetical protein